MEKDHLAFPECQADQVLKENKVFLDNLVWMAVWEDLEFRAPRATVVGQESLGARVTLGPQGGQEARG